MAAPAKPLGWVSGAARRAARVALLAAGVPPSHAGACEAALYWTASTDAAGEVIDDPLLAPVSAAQLAAAVAGEYASRLLALVGALKAAGPGALATAAGGDEAEAWWAVGAWREADLERAGGLEGRGWEAAARAKAAAARDALRVAAEFEGARRSLHPCPVCGGHNVEEPRAQVRCLDEGETTFLWCRDPACGAKSQIRG